MQRNKKLILKFEEITIKDVPLVGGKNASLGEMIRYLAPQGVRIPSGFVVTAAAYRSFLKKSRIPNPEFQINPKSKKIKKKITLESFIKTTLKGLDTKDLKNLAERGRLVRETIKKTELPSDLKRAIANGYANLEKRYGKNADVAVRSSATAEDLPGASFAGEHDTYLNMRGVDEVIEAVRAAMASLFTDRAISYRVDKKFDHLKVALSVGVQKMVRSDKGASGVMFTVDTESGFRDLVIINGSWGLGEMIVQGEVTPDEFLVFKKNLEISIHQPHQHTSVLHPIISKKLGVKNRKMIYSEGRGIKTTKIITTNEREKDTFVLSEKEALHLAEWGALIEKHYSEKNKKWTPMDIEWAKDGKNGELYIVQARPETVQAGKDFSKIKEYNRKENGKILVRGASVGSNIASGKARVILDAKRIKEFKTGEVLVTTMTDPDWEPIMKIASAIVTDKGGRTSHAAIVSRELGIPCVVGTENATRIIRTGQEVTVDTTGSEGFVFAGTLKFEVVEHDIKKIPKPKVHIMVNIATPDSAFEKSFLPTNGVGLAREEFIIAGDIGIHPNLLLNFEKIKKKFKILPLRGISQRDTNSKLQTNSKFKISKDEVKRLVKKVEEKMGGWKSPTQFYVDKLAYGIAKIGAAFYPKPVIVRFSDFKTNEYRTLLGGDLYEPKEENPMIGWRGASRYYNPNFADAFALEVKAMKKVRNEMGLTNIIPMIPFVRTPEEGKRVVGIMKKNGLSRKKDATLKIYMMCEIPSDVLRADEFLDIFDGMSIGSNDLTQLTVGIDRDGNESVRGITNENDESVKKFISEVIQTCKRRKKYIGICGQAPSDYPEFAEFLLKEGIDSISLNPDTVIKTTIALAKKHGK